MADSFSLDPQLAADTHPIVRWSLSEVLLMDDARFPWIILVPRVPEVTEAFQLTDDQQHQLLRETTETGRALSGAFGADKINTAALGNVVSQLHVHVIARSHDDAAWPRPVWGTGTACRYDAGPLAEMLTRLRAALPPL